MSAQQMAVVAGPGSPVCECLPTRKKLLSAQQTPHGSWAGDGMQGREAQ